LSSVAWVASASTILSTPHAAQKKTDAFAVTALTATSRIRRKGMPSGGWSALVRSNVAFIG
jgi:hypothetical protein